MKCGISVLAGRTAASDHRVGWDKDDLFETFTEGLEPLGPEGSEAAAGGVGVTTTVIVVSWTTRQLFSADAERAAANARGSRPLP